MTRLASHRADHRPHPHSRREADDIDGQPARHFAADGLSLCVQYDLRLADFRRPPSTPEDIAAVSFMPLAEAAVFMLWMVSGTLHLQLADIFGLASPRETLFTLFVVCAHLILLVRGVAEIHEVIEVRRRTSRLRDMLSSPSASRPALGNLRR